MTRNKENRSYFNVQPVYSKENCNNRGTSVKYKSDDESITDNDKTI